MINHTVDIGLSLKILMKKHGTSRQHISSFIGVTSGTLSRISNSSFVGIRHLDELSNYFNLAPSEFLKVSENALDEIVNSINNRLDKATVSNNGVGKIKNTIKTRGLEVVKKSVDSLIYPCNTTWAEDIKSATQQRKGGEK